jgi:hypothetical protein
MGLFLLSVETGEKPRITLPPNEYDDVDPALSPDMRHLVFARYTGAAGARVISTPSTFLVIFSLRVLPTGLRSTTARGSRDPESFRIVSLAPWTWDNSDCKEQKGRSLRYI